MLYDAQSRGQRVLNKLKAAQAEAQTRDLKSQSMKKVAESANKYKSNLADAHSRQISMEGERPKHAPTLADIRREHMNHQN